MWKKYIYIEKIKENEVPSPLYIKCFETIRHALCIPVMGPDCYRKKGDFSYLFVFIDRFLFILKVVHFDIPLSTSTCGSDLPINSMAKKKKYIFSLNLSSNLRSHLDIKQKLLTFQNMCVLQLDWFYLWSK